MDGHGEFKWDDGREYTGEWTFGKRNGQGHFIWADGREYDGQW